MLVFSPGRMPFLARDLIDSATFRPDEYRVAITGVYHRALMIDSCRLRHADRWVALLDMAVAPYFVGVDIGCRVRLFVHDKEDRRFECPVDSRKPRSPSTFGLPHA